MVTAIVCDRPGCNTTVKERDLYFTIHGNKTNTIENFHLCNKCIMRAMEPIVKTP